MTNAAPSDLSGFTHEEVDVDATRLHAVVGGEGGPVPLLHGRPQTWRAWREIMAPLAGQVR